MTQRTSGIFANLNFRFGRQTMHCERSVDTMMIWRRTRLLIDATSVEGSTA